MKQFEAYVVVYEPRQPIGDLTINIQANDFQEVSEAIDYFQSQNPNAEVQRVVEIG